MLNWDSKETSLLINPRFSPDERTKIEEAVAQNPVSSSVWLRSSGTESSGRGIKLVQLKKSAILEAAASVNTFLQITSKDRWLNVLPLFHIGGLSISARCFLSGATEVLSDESWDPRKVLEKIKQQSITVMSLVPTQVYDLVSHKIKCPSHLTRVLVGGGAIHPSLWERASQLGWPLLPSYGMTETSAMMACVDRFEIQEDPFPWMSPLSHMSIKANESGNFEVHSGALFSGYFFIEKQGFSFEERQGPFVLNDRIELKDGKIRVLGRETELVKVLGESVNLKSLEMRIEQQLGRAVAVQAQFDERRGYNLILWVEGHVEQDILNEINLSLIPYERVSELKIKDVFPRSSLGKINKQKLFSN